MERIRIYAFAMVLLLLAVSCIDKDILNISDSVEINSRYSVPVGSYDADINDYLESLDVSGPSSGDSLYYEGILYPINEPYVDIFYSDSLNFNLIEDPSGKVKSVEFVVLITNGYPVSAVVQVYFMSGSVKVDSAFINGPRVINPALVNSEGLVTEPFTTLLTIAMPEDFNDKLSTIRGIRVESRIYLTRPDIRFVKFFQQYKLNLHIGARVEMLFNTGEL